MPDAGFGPCSGNRELWAADPGDDQQQHRRQGAGGRYVGKAPAVSRVVASVHVAHDEIATSDSTLVIKKLGVLPDSEHGRARKVFRNVFAKFLGS